MIRAPAGAALLGLAAACARPAPPPVYQAVAVERRDIIVSAQASGAVRPDTTVEVKSKASGEILEIRVETGDRVKAGALMVVIDPREPRNALAQARADLDVANAQLANAEAGKRRADELFASQSIAEVEHEQSLLAYANARAAVVRAQVSVETARDQLDDTRIRAPIGGTILVKNVERGQVISSPTRDVGGGTVLLQMADLTLVQVRTLVDETDIGKVAPGLHATIVPDAYPNRPFDGVVLKIEPQAEVQQNVTTFPVLVQVDNREGLLRPGMNCEVEIHVGRREGVLAIPYAALRTTKDVASAAQVLGLDPREAQRQLAASGDTRHEAAGGGGAGRRPPAPAAAEGRLGGRFIVFAKRGGAVVPVPVRTGLTDLDFAEVVDGLTEGDSVLVLPSSSLVQSQQQFRERMNRITGGGLPGVRTQQPGRRAPGSRGP